MTSLKTPGGSTLKMPAAPSEEYIDDFITKQTTGADVGLGPKDQLASGLLRWVLVFLGLFLIASYIHWVVVCIYPGDTFKNVSAKDMVEIHFEWIRLIVKDMGLSIVTLLFGFLFGSQKN